MIGKVIGSYKILAELGRGPNGKVYQALDQARNQPVALKAIHPELAQQAAFNQNLRALATALVSLRHPRLAAFYTVLQQNGGELYLVSEFIQGESVAQVLQQSSVLPPEEAVTLVIQALAALNHAHKFGLVHGGIKPGNLLLMAKDQLKLTDLGLAQALGAQNTREGRGPRVLNYCAPEQIRGATVDARSDIYALGAVFFEMLTGAPPFRRANDAALRKAHVEEAAPSPRNYFPLIPALLEQAILRALAKDPAVRFQSASEFRQALLEWVNTRAAAPTLITSSTAPAKGTSTESHQPAAPVSVVPPSAAPPASVKPSVVPGIPAAASAGAGRQSQAASALHNEVVIELEEAADKRSFWKPLAAVAGLASFLGISYAFVRVSGFKAAAPSPTPIVASSSPTATPKTAVAAQISPTPTPDIISTPVASVTATPAATPAAVMKARPAPARATSARTTPVRRPVARPKPTPITMTKARPTPLATKKSAYPTPTPMATGKKEKEKGKKSGGGFFGGGSKEKKLEPTPKPKKKP